MLIGNDSENLTGADLADRSRAREIEYHCRVRKNISRRFSLHWIEAGDHGTKRVFSGRIDEMKNKLLNSSSAGAEAGLLPATG
jgi:hypothetical protein